jgi:hypothetical protein
MAHIHFLDFEIHLRDKDRVLALQANPPGETSTMPNGQKAIIRAPLTGAAIEFGNSDNGGVPIPLIKVGGTIPTSGPYLTSSWWMMADPYVPVANQPLDAATFVLKQGGWFGIPVLFPDSIRYYWRGSFVYDPPLDDQDPDVGGLRSQIMRRRWVDPGPGNMFGNREDTGTSEMSRAAGRWPDTFGFAVSGQNFTRQQRLGEYQTTTPATSDARRSWERLYIRLRQAGAGDEFWRSSGGASTHGARLDISPTGQIVAYNHGAATTIMGTSEALEVGKWYKLDILLSYADGGAGYGSEDFNPGGAYPGARFRLFLNNVEVMNVVPPAVGLGSVGFHVLSQIGTSVANSTMMLDIGFWMNARHPDALNGIDFLNGSKPVLLRGDSFSGDHDGAAWPGSVQVLAQVPHKLNSLAPVSAEHLVSTTNAGRMAIVTDAARIFQAPGAIGVVAFTVCHYGHGNLNGQLGYRLAAGADVLKVMGADGSDGVIAESIGTQTFPSRSRMMWNPSHGELPPDPATILPVELLRIKGADANTSRTYQLQAVAELIGTFGNEDYPGTFSEELKQPIVLRGVHNAPFPRTAWAQGTAPPISNVTIKTGTYVGTGTDQTLTFKSPFNFIWIRSTAGNPRGARWWASMQGPTSAGAKNPYGWMIPRIEMDPNFVTPVAEDAASFQSILRLAGTDAEVNANGVTYCYTSVMDPGMRFMLASAMWHIAAAQPKVANLIVPSFAPLFAFLLDQRFGVYNNDAFFVKGPGNAGTEIVSAGGALTAAGLAFGIGDVTHHTGLGAENFKHIAALYFRRDDGSGHAGVVRVFGMGSYVGNGVATRDITVIPISERRPVFIVVVPSNTQPGYYRDCQMPTTESRDLVDDGAVSNTAITAGMLNGFVVGSTLNTNAVTYHYFVIWGGDVAGNGGMSQCGEFDPVPPDKPPCIREEGEFDELADPGGCDPGGPDPPVPPGPPEPPGEPPGNPGGGGCDDIASDLTTECRCHTERLANLALQRIGISQAIVDLSTDNTEPAANVRLAYARCLRTVLHDRPWPFATRVAQLTLLTGSPTAPANSDWMYAYQQPADCIFERRIVPYPRTVGELAGGDPTPPPFRLSFDNTSAIRRILTNQANARLEYTARPECSAGRGDALFFDALAWKLAEQIAAPLTRMPEQVKFCGEMYLQCLAKFDEIINLGNAGPRVTLDPDGLDTATGAQTSNIGVVNRALIRIGARSIANLGTEQSREADLARSIFEEELRGVLRDYPWSFATGYLEGLELVRGPRTSSTVNVQVWSATAQYVEGDTVEDSGTTYYALQASTGIGPPSALYWTTTPTRDANDDWGYAWRLPVLYVMVRRIVTPSRRRAEVNPEEYRTATDLNGPLVYTNIDDPTLEVTMRIPSVVRKGDALFRDAFAWRLAACLAPSLATVDPDVPEQLGRGQRTTPKERKPIEAQLRARAATYAWQQYYLTIEKARIADAREQQQEDGPDAPWITGR